MSDEVIIGLIIYNAVVSTATLVWLGRNVWTRFQVKRELKNYDPVAARPDRIPFNIPSTVKQAQADVMSAYRATPRHPEEKASVKPIKGQWGAIRERVEASE